MKTKITSLLVLSLFFLQAPAQITINRDDMPNTNDTIRRSMTIAPSGINFDSTGTNFTWDFSTLNWISQQLDTFAPVNTCPLAYQLVFNLPFDPNKATICSPQASYDSLAGISLQDVYTFFRETNTIFGFLGFGATLNGITLPIKYNTPDVLFTFPLTPGNSDSSTASFSLSLPGIGYIATTRHRVNHVDGWGNIITPYGNFPCIRVKSIVSEYDSIYIDSLASGYPLNRFFTEYKWLADNKGLPVLEVSVENMISTVLYLDSARSHVQEINGQVLYNNLMNTPIALATVELKNMAGITLAQTQSDSNGHYTFPGVPDGAYTLALSDLPAWQGINATDALLILQHFVGMLQLTGLSEIAADVDQSGYINSTDALLVAQRFVGLVSTFPAGDWVVETVQLNISGQSLTRNIKVQCVGDVDASY